jgi:hypothetical protein
MAALSTWGIASRIAGECSLALMQEQRYGPGRSWKKGSSGFGDVSSFGILRSAQDDGNKVGDGMGRHR